MTTPTNESFTDEVMTEFAKTIELFGLGKLESRVFAYLFLSKEPLTLDELSEALGKSKTAMSTSVRRLSAMNLVSRAWKKGVRKDLYQTTNQLFKTLTNSFLNKWSDATHHQQKAIEILQEESEIEPDEFTEKRVKEIITFHEKLGKLMNDMKQ